MYRAAGNFTAQPVRHGAASRTSSRSAGLTVSEVFAAPGRRVPHYAAKRQTGGRRPVPDRAIAIDSVDCDFSRANRQRAAGLRPEALRGTDRPWISDHPSHGVIN